MGLALGQAGGQRGLSPGEATHSQRILEGSRDAVSSDTGPLASDRALASVTSEGKAGQLLIEALPTPGFQLLLQKQRVLKQSHSSEL